MKRIDAEAAVALIRTAMSPIGGTIREGHELLDEIRALPAAVPVVDVEKAARKFHAIIHDAAPEEFPPEDEPLDNDEEAWLRQQSRAILSAGYVGAVSVGDVRQVAECLRDECHGCDAGLAAATRLLAAVEGKP